MASTKGRRWHLLVFLGMGCGCGIVDGYAPAISTTTTDRIAGGFCRRGFVSLHRRQRRRRRRRRREHDGLPAIHGSNASPSNSLRGSTSLEELSTSPSLSTRQSRSRSPAFVVTPAFATTSTALFVSGKNQSEPTVPLPQQQTSTPSTSLPSMAAAYASPLINSATYSSSVLMDPIVGHPSVALLDLETRPRKKLKPRHKDYFLSTAAAAAAVEESDSTTQQHTLFEKLALACCESEVVPRKEFFETYASARYIHKHAFPEGVHRVADLAAGHGLLSWMLLAMDEYEEDGSLVVRRNEKREQPREEKETDCCTSNKCSKNGSNNKSENNGSGNVSGVERPTRSAICVDMRMPPSALAIARSMRRNLFPIGTTNNNNGDETYDDEASLYDHRWTYVQTDLKNVVADDSSTLLVSVHACGTLSDFLIGMAISAANAPLALVPCCHTYSVRKGYTPHPEFSGTTAEEVGSRIETRQEEAMAAAAAAATTATIASNPAAATTASKKTKKKINKKFQIVENVIDEVRLKTLRNAGYDGVRIASLPQEFTERNRLFMVSGDSGDSNSVPKKLRVVDDCENVLRNSKEQANTGSDAPAAAAAAVPKPIRRGSMPPMAASAVAATAKAKRQKLLAQTDNDNSDDKPSFLVPLRDDPQSIEDCLKVSGKAKALQRLRELLPNHFAPKLDVSMWLSPPLTTTTTESSSGGDADDSASGESLLRTNTNKVTTEGLRGVLDETVRSYRESNKNNKKAGHKSYACTIRPINERYIHPKTGRVACTYQIEYSYDLSSSLDDDGSPFPKNVAKQLHKSFCDNAVRSIGGIEIR